METVSVRNIEKSYGKVKALRGITLNANKGEIFGIIGPDGAGKTSLFRILTTLILADQGEVSVIGLDVVNDYREIRKRIGYMPGRFSLYQDLTVEENLQFFATLFQTTVQENYHLIRDIYEPIEPFKKRRAGKLSGGMKQKLALSCALIHKPEVLFLDEPTTGVDPVSRKEFWEMLRRLKNEGITILVSTAYMDEASLCDRIALINEGRFLTIDTPANIINSYTETLWAISASHMPRLLKTLRSLDGIRSAFAFGDRHHFTVDKSYSIESLHDTLEAAGYSDINIRAIRPSVEDCFMSLATTK